MKVRVELEYDPEGKGWLVACPELPGCASCGDTEAEALSNIKKVIQLHFTPSEERSTPGARSVMIEV